MKRINQLKVGTRIEREHKGLGKWIERFEERKGRLPSDHLIAKHIAQAHLKETKNYYSKLLKARL
jgi:hypothetical protein